MAPSLRDANLKSVGANRPNLIQTTSKHSFAASDDYHTVDEQPASTATTSAGSGEKPTVVRRLTPPHLRTPASEPDHRHAAYLPTTSPDAVAAAVVQANPAVDFDENYSIRRKPVSGEGGEGGEGGGAMQTWRNPPPGVTSPTPGLDDSPYIQFAIDQLTRDEDLSGAAASAVPIAAAAPAGHQAHVVQPRPPHYQPVGQALPYEPFAGPAPSRMLTTVRPVARSPDQFVDAPELPITQEPIPVAGSPRLYRAVGSPPMLEPVETTAQLPAPSSATRASSEEGELGRGRLVDLSQLPKDDHAFPPLDFVPIPLRLPSILGLILLCLVMMVLLILSSVWSTRNAGLDFYDGTGTRLYFVYQYLPQLIAAIVLLWLRVVQAAVQRILPFALMASSSSSSSGRRRGRVDVARTTPLFVTNWLLPSLSGFRDGEPLLGTCSVIFWLALWTVPLASCVYQARYADGAWFWTTVQGVAWALTVLYFLLVLGLLGVYVRFATRPTGLKWDPTSLADVLVLLRRSASLRAGPPSGERPGQRPTSLGYWESPDRPGHISYGIGEDSTPNSPDLERGDKAPLRDSSGALVDRWALPSSTFDSWASAGNGASRYGWIPWFLRDSIIVLWLAVALVLMIAFVVVSFVNRAVENGFLPLVAAGPRDLNFSAANFLYSFLPACLGMLLYLLWLPIDAYFRALQPFAELAAAEGAPAERSLLLSYSAGLPLAVTAAAAANRHFKVAWFSLVSVVSILIPVLAGGVFTAQYVADEDRIREIASMPGYVALVVFVVAYAFTYTAIWPQRKRYLPHDVRTVADVRDYVVGGELLARPEWREPRTKADLVTRLLSAGRLTGEKGTGRYRFGAHLARDGRTERMGIFAI